MKLNFLSPQTSLFGNVRRILRGRFHDYLIYEPENLKLDMDVYGAMYSYGMLDNSTPLQVWSYLLWVFSFKLVSQICSGDREILTFSPTCSTCVVFFLKQRKIFVFLLLHLIQMKIGTALAGKGFCSRLASYSESGG